MVDSLGNAASLQGAIDVWKNANGANNLLWRRGLLSQDDTR